MSLASKLKNRSAALIATLLACTSGAANAAGLSIKDLAGDLAPSTLFAQAGFAENNTQSYVIGATWDWHWKKNYSFGAITGFSEASFGKWITHGEGAGGSSWATQVGITPVLRLQPAVLRGEWFVEIGIGANLILPIYRNEEKEFSTEFNFGDHLAVGRLFGKRRKQELALRLQHFSNAGIDHPNPGENFTQIRYSYRF